VNTEKENENEDDVAGNDVSSNGGGDL